MLRYRLIFGPLMLAALFGVIWFDSWLQHHVTLTGTVWQDIFAGRDYLPAGPMMWLLFMALIPLAARELVGIFRAKGIAADVFLVALGGMAGCTLVYVVPHDTSSQSTSAIVATLMAALFLAALLRHSWGGRIQGAVAMAGVTMFATVYLGLFPGFYLAIRRWHSAWIVAGIIAVTKSCDIGAYFTGRAIGRHKLIPWLSPGKTWEGLVGGVVFSGLVAMGLVALGNASGAIGYYSKPETHVVTPVEAVETSAAIAAPATSPRQPDFQPARYPMWFAFIAGALIGLVGQAGDLTASLFKRDAGVKDSGRSIPGFGGVIDVLDSPTIVAPLAYWLLVLADTLFAVAPPDE